MAIRSIKAIAEEMAGKVEPKQEVQPKKLDPREEFLLDEEDEEEQTQVQTQKPRKPRINSITPTYMLKGIIPDNFIVFTIKKTKFDSMLCQVLYPEEFAGEWMFASRTFNLEPRNYYAITTKDDKIVVAKITKDDKVEQLEDERLQLFPNSNRRINIEHTEI